jgi:hypothetical protein
MRKALLIATVLAVCAMPVLASAEDLFPPWWRGEWSTTSQVWEFGTSDPGNPLGPGLPPDGPAPGGMPPLPSTMVWITPLTGAGWYQEDNPILYTLPDGTTGEAGYGVWPLSGIIEILVDNHDPRPETIKLMWLQLTWRPQDLGEKPIFEYLDPVPISPPEIVGEIIFDQSDPLSWRTTAYAWQLDWNPPDEWITIGGTINIDELVIDTWCVPIPEPGILAIAGVGLLGLLSLRRRK